MYIYIYIQVIRKILKTKEILTNKNSANTPTILFIYIYIYIYICVCVWVSLIYNPSSLCLSKSI